MPPAAVVISIAIVVTMDIIIVSALVYACRQMMEPLRRSFPPVEPREGAVTRGFQSLRLGMMNFGWSVHITVDEDHLHLSPTRLGRYFGMPRVSIPWPQIAYVRPAMFGSAIVKVRGMQITGPSWAFRLAETDAPKV